MSTIGEITLWEACFLSFLDPNWDVLVLDGSEDGTHRCLGRRPVAN